MHQVSAWKLEIVTGSKLKKGKEKDALKMESNDQIRPESKVTQRVNGVDRSHHRTYRCITAPDGYLLSSIPAQGLGPDGTVSVVSPIRENSNPTK